MAEGPAYLHFRPVQKVWSWIVTVPFLLVFGLTLLVFDVVGRLVRPFSLTAFEWVMATLQRTMLWVFRLFGTRIEVDKHPGVEPKQGYVVIANHQSLFDIALIGGVLYSNLPKYVAKRELGRWIPSVSLNLKQGGHALIDRGDSASALEEIAALGRRAQERNRSAVIFPEGTRSRGSELRPIRRAGAEALLAAADRLPVVPVALVGSWRLNRLVPFTPGTRVRIRVGAPLARTADDAAERLGEAWEWISQQVATEG